MSIKSNASSNPGHDGNVTRDQIDELERLRVQYVNSKGSADENACREAYQDYATKLLIDLSGKLDPADPANDVPEKPTEGVIKTGGNQDPNTWHINAMRDDPSLFKIIDDASKNIATDFRSVATAQQYINYYKWEKEHGSVVKPVPVPEPGPSPGPTPGPTPTPVEGVDQFGIRMICPSASSGKIETGFKLEEKQRNYASGKPSEWSTEYTNISKDIIQNVEVTLYEKVNGFKKEADTISLKLGGPPHKDGAKFWVIPDFATDGSPKRTMEIEDPHPKNHPINPKPLSEMGGGVVGKWFGYKGISYQSKDGTRHVESWIHLPVTDIENVKNEQDKWRKYMEYTCDKKYNTFLGKLTTSRLDGVKKGDPPTFKYASVREIQPPT